MIVGSVAEIHAQSDDFRTSTDTGYGQLATLVAEASNQTGAQLAQLMQSAPQLPVSQVPQTARAELQQGLDRAVDATRTRGDQGGRPGAAPTRRHGERPVHPGDGRAGRRPPPISAPASTGCWGWRRCPSPVPPPRPRASAPSPAPRSARRPRPWAVPASDSSRPTIAYRVSWSPMCAINTYRLRLPSSVWVPAPVDGAPLGSAPAGRHRLGAGELPGLGPGPPAGHHAPSGLSPPAVATGGPGHRRRRLQRPRSSVPGPAPTVLPTDQHGHRGPDGDQLRHGAPRPGWW